MPHAIGIDIGSLNTKAVLLGPGGILASAVLPTGDETEATARQALERLAEETGFRPGEDACIVATGIGGRAITFARQSKAITTCLARGTAFLFPSARMVVDIGAESCTVVKLNSRGRVVDWAGHDKCAAGTGIFLQQMARLLQIPITGLSALSLAATGRADITSTCAVFAESDVISHVHRDPPTPREDIAAGIYHSVVSRIAALCKRIGIEKDVAAAGGVAQSQGLVKMLSEELGCTVLVPPQPPVVAALGAAVLAREHLERGAGR